MTLITTTVRTDAVGDGAATTFPTVFQFLLPTDLVVKLAGVTQGYVEDYEVTGGLGATGAVVFNAAPAAAVAVAIERVMPFTQPYDLTGQGRFYPETHEESYDRITMLLQQLEARIAACEDHPI